MKNSHWQGFPSKSTPQIPDTDSAWLEGADGESKTCDVFTRSTPESSQLAQHRKLCLRYQLYHSPSSSSEGESCNTSNTLSLLPPFQKGGLKSKPSSLLSESPSKSCWSLSSSNQEKEEKIKLSQQHVQIRMWWRKRKSHCVSKFFKSLPKPTLSSF